MNYKAKVGAITPKQIRIIKMAQRELDMDDASYRQLLFDEFCAAKSCTALSAAQADRLIDILQQKGFAFKPTQKGWRTGAPGPGQKRKTSSGKKVTAMVSPAERSKIAAVAALIDWHVKDGLALFLKKRVKIKDGKVRTAADAYLAIEALKKMFENGMKKQQGPEWWIMQFEDELVMGYIERHKPEEYQ